MNIIIPVKLVPDLVEELEIDDTGAALDTTFMRMNLNELDEHAIEQGILLKERIGGEVTVLILDGESADDVLYAAAAKGADRLIKIVGAVNGIVSNHVMTQLLQPVVEPMQPDLVLTGVQAHNDLDGSLGPLLAEALGLPYVGYVSGVTKENGTCAVRKEYPGGLIAEMEVNLPAVLGIQAADKPPRYVAISKIRQAMKTTTIEEHAATAPDLSGALSITRMFQPEAGERAMMIEGDEGEIAAKLIEIFREQGVL